MSMQETPEDIKRHRDRLVLEVEHLRNLVRTLDTVVANKTRAERDRTRLLHLVITHGGGVEAAKLYFPEASECQPNE